jgi:hypothetical protein
MCVCLLQWEREHLKTPGRELVLPPGLDVLSRGLKRKAPHGVCVCVCVCVCACVRACAGLGSTSMPLSLTPVAQRAGV